MGSCRQSTHVERCAPFPAWPCTQVNAAAEPFYVAAPEEDMAAAEAAAEQLHSAFVAAGQPLQATFGGLGGHAGGVADAGDALRPHMLDEDELQAAALRCVAA